MEFVQEAINQAHLLRRGMRHVHSPDEVLQDFLREAGVEMPAGEAAEVLAPGYLPTADRAVQHDLRG